MSSQNCCDQLMYIFYTFEIWTANTVVSIDELCVKFISALERQGNDACCCKVYPRFMPVRNMVLYSPVYMVTSPTPTSINPLEFLVI